MNNQDRSLKILLALLVVGVWGLLLRPIVSTTQVAAQPSKQRAPQYALAIQYQGKNGQTVITIKPILASVPTKNYNTSFIKPHMEEAIKAGISKGWRVHAMTESNSYVSILFEK